MPLSEKQRANISEIIESNKNAVKDILKKGKEEIDTAKQILREKADKRGIKHNIK